MMVQYSGTARNGLALYGGGNGHTVVRFYFATYIGFVVCSVPLYREEYRSDIYIRFMMGTAADTAAVQQFVVYWSGFISEQEDVMKVRKREAMAKALGHRILSIMEDNVQEGKAESCVLVFRKGDKIIGEYPVACSGYKEEPDWLVYMPWADIFYPATGYVEEIPNG